MKKALKAVPKVLNSGGGGNCTRDQIDASRFSETLCEKRCAALSELCRDDEALRELVVNWQRLSPSVRGAILELARQDRSPRANTQQSGRGP